MKGPSPAAVLAAATLVASPALWSALGGGLPVDVALIRYLLAMVACWGALALVRTFAWPDEPAPDGHAASTAPAQPDGTRAGEGVQTPSNASLSAEFPAA